MENSNNQTLNFLIERFAKDLDSLRIDFKTDIDSMKKDIKDLQISTAKSDTKTGLIWAMATAFIMGIVGLAVKIFQGGVK